MTKKKLNVFIIIMVICIAVLFASTFAYEKYRIWKSDQEASANWENEKNQLEEDNSVGNINDDLKDEENQQN